ncbi:TonB-dependent receptor domain-containing protein [Ningiella sp. W23]|uniref:TonB-dependent receptor domain-containing protein n=1 Tax=Ningiella sp. W23 TaxID=3023715 RepID=UPI0037576D26
MKLNKIALVLAMSGLGVNAYAQQATDEELLEENNGEVERIEVTGSSIKRTSLEGDLPLTVISRAEIDAAGITSADQLLLQLNISSNSNDNLASNAGIVGGEERGNNGASSANLRQQGVGSTLVLLNGRRIATHGLKGRSVDLNSIPFAAIERVEILRDGASAVYGTDAIGGVINFILKQNYNGLQLGAFADHTEDGGGNIYRLNVLAGTGDMNKDGYNVMGSLAYKSSEILRGTDRDFTNTFQPDRGLSPDTRGAPFASINDRWSSPNDPTSNHYNLIGSGLTNPNTGLENDVLNVLALPGQPGCDAIENMGPDQADLWNRTRNLGVSCAWDYPRAAVLQQPVESLDFVGRGTMAVGEDSEAFIELLGSEVVSKKVFEPNQITPWAIGNGDWDTFGGGWYPSTGASYDYIVDALSDFYGADQLNIGAPIAYRWRCMDCGPREIETTTTSYKIQLGIEGVIGGDWDYKAGLSRSANEAESELGGGYHYVQGLAEAIGTGVLNPFLLPGQSQTPEALQMLENASARGVTLFGGKTIMTQIDATISGDTGFELGLGGDSIYVAAGIDLRREEYEFNGDRRVADERPTIYGAPFDDANALENVSRDIKAIFVEALVPVVESLELNLALRHDDYDGFGGTTNPKYGFKFTPIDELLFRGSYSTGFRVPSFNQLFNGITAEPYTGTDLANPFLCPDGIVIADNPSCQPITPAIFFGGQPDLGPEESNQSSLGVVFATDDVIVNVDWWEIEIEGTIQTPGFRELIENPELFSDNFLFAPDGSIVAIDRRFINAGGRQTSGVEVGLVTGGDIGDHTWALNFNGSYLIEDIKQERDNAPFGPNLVGTHSRGNIPLRWKHTVSFTYSYEDFTHVLTQVYRHSYDDETPPGVASGEANPPNYDGVVGSYLVYNYSINYTGWEDTEVIFGVRNLFDRDPPFTAHQNDFSPGAAFDPRVADPRGRSFTLQVNYDF